MLIYAVEKFVIRPEFWDVPVDDFFRLLVFHDYRNSLIVDDYLGRKGCQIFEDSKTQVLCIAGVLGYPEALDDARLHPPFGERFEKINAQSSLREVQYFDIHPDDHYCQHKKWTSLILYANPLCGLPSFKCSDCGGLIAKYRLPIREQTRWKIWDWERQSDAIDDLALLCGEYEPWAEGELGNIQSKLNQLGLSIRQSLLEELNCPVYYTFSVGLNRLSECPQCGATLKPSSVLKHSEECSSCKLLVFNCEEEEK
jgi:hypothetical protein